MRITYIHHSCFLVETGSCYYLFDYEKGSLPQMDGTKPIFVLASHGHHDHYTPKIFTLLSKAGMQKVSAVLSDDIHPPRKTDTIQVAAGKEYTLPLGQRLTTFASTDLGVAFLIEDPEGLIYHAGDLNDWVWEEETDSYNTQMTADYRHQIGLLREKLGGRAIDTSFVVLDPRQEADYARGICHFLEHIRANKVFPMHFWGNPGIIETFLNAYPQYEAQIQKPQ